MRQNKLTAQQIEKFFESTNQKAFSNMSAEVSYDGLKDINTTPKDVKKPIFTPFGKKVFIVVVLVGAAYLLYKKNQANQVQAQQVPRQAPPSSEQPQDAPPVNPNQQTPQ